MAKRPPQPGIFIVLEGADGSGKGTQFRLLTERLKAAGHDIAVFDFPRYEEESSHFVREYLNGSYGPAANISPFSASMFFALDRYEAAPQIKKALEQGKIVLSNRYVGSNMAHQGSKFGRTAERRAFFLWAENLEYEVLGIPRPNINIFLRVPAEISHELISQKAARSYTKASHDEHEGDMNHLRESVAAYDLMCELFTKDFKAIDCVENGMIKSVAEINNLIWQQLQPILPTPSRRGKAVTLKLDNKKQTGTTGKNSNNSVPRLSVLSLLQIITANPEKQIKWRAISKEHYPPSLPKATNDLFAQRLKEIDKIRKKIVTSLKGSAAEEVGQALLPLASLADLLAIEEHWRWPTSNETKNIIPRNAQSYQPAPLAEIASDYGAAGSDDQANLVWAGYRNEFDILAAHGFEQQAGSYEELKRQIIDWPYQKKADSLIKVIQKDALLRHKVPYRFEVTATIAEILHLYQHGHISGIRLQSPSPRLGYPIPDAVERAGLAETYSEAFDLSFELYAQLEAVKPEIAAYGLLIGHRLRWHISVDLENLWISRKNELFRSMIEQIAPVNPLIAEQLHK